MTAFVFQNIFRMNPFAIEVAFHSYDRDFVVSAAYLFILYVFILDNICKYSYLMEQHVYYCCFYNSWISALLA